MNQRYHSVIWDWNGTLLDDQSVAMEAVNQMLTRRGLPPMDRERYCSYMEMPIVRFYEKTFDFQNETFSQLVSEWNEAYARLVLNCQLMPGAVAVLTCLQEAGIAQYLVSASEESKLLTYTEHFGIRPFFQGILGAKDHYSASKIQLAKEYWQDHELSANGTLVIGDLLHDRDMADALGADCLLHDLGHQSRFDLEATGLPVLHSLTEIPAFLGL